ncbi:MAG: hypothetical protein R3338_05145 [Thermoanaerobaculia bacterium]|nr:hypothetical protein [Thermoanaerobaculia bacterium]
MRRAALALGLSFLAIASACGELKSPTEPIQPPSEPDDPSATFSRVQNEVFTPSCAFSGCHGAAAPQAGMELTEGVAYSNIVNVPSTEVPQFDRVEPGRPEQSYLYLKITGSDQIIGSRMPLGQPELPEDEVELVRDWIARGAPND